MVRPLRGRGGGEPRAPSFFFFWAKKEKASAKRKKPYICNCKVRKHFSFAEAFIFGSKESW